jgi:hypothetical protein
MVQSAYLRCQFHETQFHVYRAFALRDPPDPELSVPSMVVCKNAAKQCIAIVDSVKDLLLIPFRCFGLLVRPDASLLPCPFNTVLETRFLFRRISDNSFLENWRYCRQFTRVPRYRDGNQSGRANLRRVMFHRCDLLNQRLTFYRCGASRFRYMLPPCNQ